jgi:LuxR family maltose regulon positive regulatory protein
VLAPAIAVLQARLATVEGRRDAGETLLDRLPPTAELFVARARMQLAAGEAEAAIAKLEPVVNDEVSVTYGRTRIDAAILLALAADRLRRPDEVRWWIESALELAEPEGFRRPFLEVGQAIVEPLRLAIRRGTAHRWLAAALLSTFDGRSPGGSAPLELLDPLSEKEQVVLRYLPTLMSNQEIAGELFVSVNTIKTHLKSIYRKLGAPNRREAVLRARELRLIGT